MALELTGKILQKLPVQEGTSARGPWSKQEFILETQESYPRKICISVFGSDKVKDLASYEAGDIVKASINIESREYNGRWYTDVRAWRILKEGGSGNGPAAPLSPSTPAVPPPAVEDLTVGPDQEDDLPF